MWAILDDRTLALLLAFFLALCTGCVGLLMLSRRPIPGATDWGLAYIAYVIGTMALLIRPTPTLHPLQAIGIFAGGLTATLIWSGARRWRGRGTHWGVIAAVPVALVAVIAVGQAIWPGQMLILAASPLTVCLMLGLACREVWRVAELRLVGWMILGCILVRLVRMLLFPGVVVQGFDWAATSVLLVFSVQVFGCGITMYRAVARQDEAITQMRLLAPRRR